MQDTLSATFAALSDPTRRAMLDRLTRGNATVGELAAPHRISLPAVSRHLKVLEQAGLIVKDREAQWRRCRLDAEPLRQVEAWMTPYRSFLESRFDRLDAHLRESGNPISATS